MSLCAVRPRPSHLSTNFQEQDVRSHRARFAPGFFLPLPENFFPRTCCISIDISVQTLRSLLGDRRLDLSYCFPSNVVTRRGSCRDLVRRSCQDSSFGDLVPRHCKQFCRKERYTEQLSLVHHVDLLWKTRTAIAIFQTAAEHGYMHSKRNTYGFWQLLTNAMTR